MFIVKCARLERSPGIVVVTCDGQQKKGLVERSHVLIVGNWQQDSLDTVETQITIYIVFPKQIGISVKGVCYWIHAPCFSPYNFQSLKGKAVRYKNKYFIGLSSAGHTLPN